MPVLIEAYSVIIKIASIEERFPGGKRAFRQRVPNKTYCDDGHLVRVGFMSPRDVQDYMGHLEACGLVHLEDDRAVDMTVIDQVRGPVSRCDWVLVNRVPLEGGGIQVACLKTAGQHEEVAVPSGWKFEKSLSHQHTYIDPNEVGERLEPVSEEGGLSTFLDKKTGEKVFIGSPGQSERSREFQTLKSLAERTLELDEQGNHAKSSNNREAMAMIFHELTNELLPRSKRIVLQTKFHPGFAHFVCGLLYRVLRQPEEAVEQFRNSLLHSPDTVNTLLEMTRCLGDSGRFAEAKPYAERAVEIEPSSPQALGNLAMTLIQTGDEQPAQEAISRALSLAPNDPLNQQIKIAFDRKFRKG